MASRLGQTRERRSEARGGGNQRAFVVCVVRPCPSSFVWVDGWSGWMTGTHREVAVRLLGPQHDVEGFDQPHLREEQQRQENQYRRTNGKLGTGGDAGGWMVKLGCAAVVVYIFDDLPARPWASCPAAARPRWSPLPPSRRRAVGCRTSHPPGRSEPGPEV